MPELRRNARPVRPYVVTAAIVGVPFGLAGSIFGPCYPIAVGAGLAAVGLVAAALGRRWGAVLVAFGAAICAGAAIYMTLGLLMPGDPGSGSGSGCGAGGTCG